MVRKPSFWQFIGKGAPVAVLSWGVFLGLVEVGGISYPLAVMIGGFISCVGGFFSHKFWTFGGARTSRTGAQLVRFIAVYAVFTGLNVLCMFVFVDLLGLWNIPAQALARGILAKPNYKSITSVFI